MSASTNYKNIYRKGAVLFYTNKQKHSLLFSIFSLCMPDIKKQFNFIFSCLVSLGENFWAK